MPAKLLSDMTNEKAAEFSSDDIIASTIIKAVEKQEKVNKVLADKGCNYRISDIELGMSIPPSVTFGIRRLDNAKNNTEPQ